MGVIVGVATVSASVTLRVKAVVLVTPPPVEVTVIGKLPAGVDPVVFMFNTVEHDELQEVEEKDPVAPAGKPETLKETAWLLPETNAAAIELVTEDPAMTDIFPEFDTEKLKGWLTVNEALASGLALDPLLNALAFTVALLVRLMAPVYRVEDCVGLEPLVV